MNAKKLQNNIAGNDSSTVSNISDTLAHEVKNSLNVIKINLEGLRNALERQAGDSKNNFGKYVAVIEEQVGHIDSAFKSFQGIFERVDFRFEKVDLNEIIRKLVDFFEPEASKKKIVVQLELDDGLRNVKGDKKRLQEAFLNLIVNAMEAMPDGGALSVSTCEKSKFAQLKVTDSGLGIPKKHESRIFDFYFSTKSRGRGIGLYTVKQVISRHGGEIQFQSSPGNGTVFTIRLPFSDAL